MADPPAAAFNRLRWRCRRGVRELDVLLIGYLEHAVARQGATEQALFARLLDESDTDLYLWLTRRATPDPAYTVLVDAILATASDAEVRVT